MSLVVKNGGIGASPAISKINHASTSQKVAQEMCRTIIADDKTAANMYPSAKVNFEAVNQAITEKVDALINADVASIKELRGISGANRISI